MSKQVNLGGEERRGWRRRRKQRGESFMWGKKTHGDETKRNVERGEAERRGRARGKEIRENKGSGLTDLRGVDNKRREAK